MGVRLVVALLTFASVVLPVQTTGADAAARTGTGDRFITEVPERSRPPRDGVRRPSSAASSAALQATIGDDWYDECDDAGNADIARFGIGDDGARDVSFVWATCNGKPMEYTTDEFVVFSIDEDLHDPAFRSDYAVVQWMDGYYEVYWTFDDAHPDDWYLADWGEGTIDASRSAFTVGGFTIDAIAADFPYRYHFAFQTFDGAGQRDIIPNPGQAFPTFPSNCDTYVFSDRAVVTTTELDAAVGAATDAGLDVTSVAPGLGTFTVAPVERLADLDLPGQTRAARPVAYELSAVADPEPSAWAIEQLQLERAWSARSTARVEIAVVDSGIDAGRPDLVGRVASGFDAVTGRTIPAGANSAFAPHGTAVAGIAAGTRGNGREVAGVNGGAILRPYRVMGHNGPCVESGALAAALDHIATVDSIRIVNMSLGGPEIDPPVRDAIRRVAATGKILVAATGNDGEGGTTANYPAAFPEVIGVGATGPGPAMAPYSQRAHTEFVAPGGLGAAREDSIATLAEWDGIEFGSGTSYAAPYVAGALSLWLNGNRATTDQARVALRASTTDLPGTTADGGGLVNVARLIGAWPDYPTATARDVTDTCAEHGSAGFTDTPGTTHERTIDCVAGEDITTGRTATTYAPSGSLTRGQTATFLVRTLEAAGVDVPGPTDVCSETDVHAANVERLVAAGIVPAPADRRCHTTSLIDRGLMAVWTLAALEAGGVASEADRDWYGDDDLSPHESDIERLTSLGIVTGKGGGQYGPGETLTRGQMATFLARTLDALRE